MDQCRRVGSFNTLNSNHIPMATPRHNGDRRLQICHNPLDRIACLMDNRNGWTRERLQHLVSTSNDLSLQGLILEARDRH